VYTDFLPLVSKPGRYINSEINAIHKDHSKMRTRVCLFFPDTYEVGMSHLGLRILYHILNGRADTVCERVFSPWLDYEQRLRESGMRLASLESNLPLASFDIVGVTLQYELSYSNVLAGLDLAGIPLRSVDRNDTHPLIVAGGPCAVNPGPLSPFIDVFFIGEAEEAIHELIECRQEFPDRKRCLDALAKLPGFFVPSAGAAQVRRRFVKSIETTPYPARPLLPLMKPIHDRVSVEIARGCIRGCRFCQAGVIYRPYRERSEGTIKGLLEESLQCTGYEELSLASLSAGDHSDIGPLVTGLIRQYQDSRVSVSLPSLRVGTLTPDMIKAIASTRKTGFTLAPEAGTERLRRVINKPISDSDLLSAAETIFRNGWSTIKLYFMIGLPTETEEDLMGVVRLANDLLAAGKRVAKRHIQITISVSTFVPKAHTPFQWLGQPQFDEILAKQSFLRKHLSRRGITLKTHNPETSVLEAAFARGDESLANVLEEAVRLGCRFDGWTECFNFSLWVQAFEKFGTLPGSYASRSFLTTDALPWDRIHAGVTKQFLTAERERSLAAEITENCRVSCEHCGIGCKDGGTEALGRPAPTTPPAEEPRADMRPPAAALRIRIQYSKTGRLRFLSHLDFMTMMHRACVRAGVPVFFSAGFNPHPKMAFGPALSVGIESDSEYMDMEVDSRSDAKNIVSDLNRTLPDSVRILASAIVPKHAASVSGCISRYVYEIDIPSEHRARMRELVERFLSLETVVVQKDEKSTNIRPCVEAIAVEENGLKLVITLEDKDGCRARILDVVARVFDAGGDAAKLFRVKRIAMYYRDGERWRSPLDVG
jgi:radical SAM family uncharacterized protein/radical SAM-linked protein